MIHYEVCFNLLYSLAYNEEMNKSISYRVNILLTLLVHSQQGHRKYKQPRGGNVSVF